MHNDLKHLWLPYTQMKSVKKPFKANETKDCYIVSDKGKVLIDAISSWWTSCLGYNNQYLINAVSKQLQTMPHVMFGGIIHKQAIDLSKKIVNLLKNDLEKVFFVDSGSVSVEVALKMCVQYWINKGKKKRINLYILGMAIMVIQVLLCQFVILKKACILFLRNI